MTGKIEDCEACFDAIGQKWIDDASSVKRASVPDMVYQYTDGAGLHGMLGSDEIWLTDSRFLNDKTEGLHLIRTFQDLLAARISSNYTNASETS